MPAPDCVIADKQHRGDLLAAPTVIQQHESIGAARQAMRRRAVTHKGDQVGAILGRKIASANHAL